jgi:putative endonuclease
VVNSSRYTHDYTVIPAKAGIQERYKSAMNNYYIYILASGKNGTLYIGVTNDLARRIYEHREGLLKGFTKKYNIKILVYYEEFDDIGFAIQRKKDLKKWKRSWKLQLIEDVNQNWEDLYFELD